MSARAEWRGRPVRTQPPPLVGASPLWTRAVGLAERYAPTTLPILLIGATGTGKEVLAQHIHHLSGRTGELIDVNCGALPREMTESLLFGHRRGAFTGAFEDSPGLVAQAEAGTLFLDELSSMSVEGQAKLLRVLDTGELRRLGDHVKQSVDFRVIAAVQDEVPALLEGGLLRPDLYHRLACVVIHIPRLCERPEDLSSLATHFAALHGLTTDNEALVTLRTHDWPGNVRELRAVMERAAVLTDGTRITASHVADALHGQRLPRTVAGAALRTGEGRGALLRLCEQYAGDRDAMARGLGVSRATLYRRLKAAGIKLTLEKGRTLLVSQSSHVVAETA